MSANTAPVRKTHAQQPPTPGKPAPPTQKRRPPNYRKLWDIPRYLAIITISLLCLIPIAVMLRIALTPQVDWRRMPIDWLQPADWSAFDQVLSSPFPKALLNSFIIALITTAIVILLAAMGGHALARMRGKHKERFLFLVLGTRMGPAVVFALPIFLLASSIGLVDTYPGIIAVYIVYNLAFGIWMMHGFFLDIPPEVEEAGLVDGLSEWGVFRKLSLPMASSGLIATATLVFILTWNEFFYAFVLTQQRANTFPTTIPGYFGAFQVEWGTMFAASTLGILPPVIFGILARKWLAKGLSGGLVD